MALNVLVIPEDFRKDQYMLKPIISKMLQSVGVSARVRVCQDPLLGGIGEAMKWDRQTEILDRYRGMVQLFVLIVDRDGKPNRRGRLDGLEKKAAEVLPSKTLFVAENAWQECEVWVLGGMKDLPKAWSWNEVRADVDPKETYYLPYAEQRGLQRAAHEGREVLGREAGSNYSRVKQLCVEVAELEDRVRSLIGA